MSTLTLAIGSLFADRYRIERCIGLGGMGAVYEVTHLKTERRRALKVMLPHLMQSHDLRERFQREARLAAKIQSAFLVDVFDAGFDEQSHMPFLVMELLRGEELGRRLLRLGRFGFEDTLAFLWQTALALDKTHQANIVHRDLKPENLFLCDQEDGPPLIKVLDFGVAKMFTDGGIHANATRSVGTPLYMAPEQFCANSIVSPATDIYSLGMMAYTFLVGTSYWSEEQDSENSLFAFAAIVANGPVEAARSRAARRGVALPAAFDQWFAQVTAVQPEQRFSSATAATRGLARVLGVAEPITHGPVASGSPDPGASYITHTPPRVPAPATLLLPDFDASPIKESSAAVQGFSASRPALNSAGLSHPTPTKAPDNSQRSSPAPPSATSQLKQATLLVLGGLTLLAATLFGRSFWKQAPRDQALNADTTPLGSVGILSASAETISTTPVEPQSSAVNAAPRDAGPDGGTPPPASSSSVRPPPRLHNTPKSQSGGSDVADRRD